METALLVVEDFWKLDGDKPSELFQDLPAVKAFGEDVMLPEVGSIELGVTDHGWNLSTEPLGCSPRFRLRVVLRERRLWIVFSKMYFCSDQHGFVMLVLLYSMCPWLLSKSLLTQFLSVGKLSVNNAFVLS